MKCLICETRRIAAMNARAAVLPNGYQWGHDAMEQFNTGKKYAALAIEATIVHGAHSHYELGDIPDEGMSLGDLTQGSGE